MEFKLKGKEQQEIAVRKKKHVNLKLKIFQIQLNKPHFEVICLKSTRTNVSMYTLATFIALQLYYCYVTDTVSKLMLVSGSIWTTRCLFWQLYCLISICKIYIKYISIHVKYITLQNGDQLASALKHN